MNELINYEAVYRTAPATPGSVKYAHKRSLRFNQSGDLPRANFPRPLWTFHCLYQTLPAFTVAGNFKKEGVDVQTILGLTSC